MMLRSLLPFICRRSVVTTIAILLGLFCPFHSVRAEHDGKLQVLLLGDSTTAGRIPHELRPAGPHFEQMIELLLAAEGDLPAVRVINSGKGSESVRSLLSSGRYDSDVAKLPGIDYVFIRYGLNDRVLSKNFPVEFPLDYAELIGRLRKDHPAAKLILVTNIPYENERISGDINALVKQVADKEELPLFDLYPAYAAALEKMGANALNYRVAPLARVPSKYHGLVKPFAHEGRVIVLDNELDAILGDLPGWYGDRHPNLAGYNVIALETARYLANELRSNAVKK